MNKTVTSRFVLKGDNRLNSAFGKAQQQLAQLSRRAALFSAAVVAGGVAVVRAQAQQIDVLAKTSDALGITTENLQTLHTMGELAGVGAEDLDNKLGKLQKNLGEIARRGGTMAQALEDAGLVIEDVITLPADAQFEAVARALANVDNQALRASIASDLFGRNANKLLKLTDQLANEGLAGMRAELEQLGVLISRSDAAGVERMNDSLAMAQKVAGGVAQKFTAALAPGIAAIAEEFVGAAKESGGFSDEVQSAAESTIKTIYFMIDVVDSVGRTFKISARAGIIAFESIKVAVIGAADAIINGPNRAIDLLIGKLNAIPGVDIDFRFGDAVDLRQYTENSESIIRQAMDDIDAIMLEPLPSSGLEETLRRIREQIAQVKQDVRTGAADFLDYIDVSKIPAHYDRSGLDKPSEAQQQRNALEQEYLRLVESTRTAAEAHNAEITRVDELYIAGVIPSAEAYADLLDRINDRFETSNKKVSEMSQFSLQAARDMQSQFADFLFDPFDQGLKGMLKGFAQTLRRMIADAMAAKILNSIFGTAGGSGDPASGFGAFLGSIFGGGKAAGGPVMAGVPYLVGERGPEIVVPRSNATVVPNHQLGQAAGNTNITINLPPQLARHTAIQMASEVARVQAIAKARNG